MKNVLSSGSFSNRPSSSSQSGQQQQQDMQSSGNKPEPSTVVKVSQDIGVNLKSGSSECVSPFSRFSFIPSLTVNLLIILMLPPTYIPSSEHGGIKKRWWRREGPGELKDGEEFHQVAETEISVA